MVRVIAEYAGELYDREGNTIIQLKIPNRQHANMLHDEDTEGLLSVEIKRAKSRRSIEQNRLMWALLSEIDKARNGYLSHDEWTVYLEALKRSGAKYEYIGCLAEAEPYLKQAFRAVEYIKPLDVGKGTNVYCCYYGSSKLDTKEMTHLIDTVLDMAAEAEVDTLYWREVLQ